MHWRPECVYFLQHLCSQKMTFHSHINMQYVANEHFKCFDTILRNTICASSSHIVIKMSHLIQGSMMQTNRKLQVILSPRNISVQHLFNRTFMNVHQLHHIFSELNKRMVLALKVINETIFWELIINPEVIIMYWFTNLMNWNHQRVRSLLFYLLTD